MAITIRSAIEWYSLLKDSFSHDAICQLLESGEEKPLPPAQSRRTPTTKPKARRAPRGAIWYRVQALLPASRSDILDRMGASRASAAAIISRKLRRGAIVEKDSILNLLADPRKPGK